MSDDNDVKPTGNQRARTSLHGGDDNNIKMSVTIKTSIGEIDMAPLTLEFNAPLVGTEPTIGDLWASQISQEVKKAVSSVFESKYGRRRTMGFMGSYADSQLKNSNNPSASADEKSYPSYEKMSKAWGADKKSADDAAERTALIVDDGAMCRKVCGMMMQEMGFTITYAEDGKEAVDKILSDGEVHYFDVVMMDNFMPNMDGSDAVTLLRLNGYNGAIIGLTYDLFDDSSRQFKESGCTALLAKPLRAPLLKKTLTKIGISFIDNEAT